jgi:type VI protein secretion system component Hcp
MADTYFFLKLEGIEGESQDTDHSSEIDVLAFALGMPARTTPERAATRARRFSMT